ncbi:MAG: biopolymer transporter ExbD [Deltaproteobacteria bacterium]|nr:biopolymer transporter ExbD [Deltaproteobacteria bacterium]
MAGGAKIEDDEVIAGINVTPLVDIMLVLLIIFMVTAKIIVSQAIPLDLPKAASGGETQMIFTVTIDKDGKVLADKRPMPTDAELRKAAADALAKNKDLRTVIQASSQVNHGTVIHVLDELRQAGIQKIGFAIDKTATATGVKTAPGGNP